MSWNNFATILQHPHCKYFPAGTREASFPAKKPDFSRKWSQQANLSVLELFAWARSQM